MKTRYGLIFWTLILFISMILPCSGALLDLNQYYHSEAELGVLILTGKNLSGISEIEKRPCPVRIVALQVQENQLKPDIRKILLSYINDGGTLWFYDSRLAYIFGMKNAPLNGKDLRYNTHRGDFGNESRAFGAATYLQAYGNHPALKGVNLVLAFLLEIGKEKFSAVEVSEGVIPILIANDPHCAAAAEKSIGRGKVILKPLLWQEAVDGKRFQKNLLEYSAGFPVPDIKDLVTVNKTRNINPKPDEVDRVILNNGQYYDGKLESKKIKIETMDSSFTFSISDLSDINIRSSLNMDEIITRDGKNFRGIVSWGDELRLKTTDDKVMTFSKIEVSKIIFRK